MSNLGVSNNFAGFSLYDQPGDKQTRVAVYGGSFNPSLIAHRRIAEALAEEFDLVALVPCGLRQDKASIWEIDPIHRREMAIINFAGLARVCLDFHDIDNGVYTTTFGLQERYESRYPKSEIWHVAGGDLLTGGARQQAEIQRCWSRGGIIWQSLNWTVVLRPGYPLSRSDLPPHALGPIVVDRIYGSGTEFRASLVRGQPALHLALPEVMDYIRKNKLYSC